MNEKLKDLTLAATIGAAALSLNGCATTSSEKGEYISAPSLNQIVENPNNRLLEAGIIFAGGALFAGASLAIYLKEK